MARARRDVEAALLAKGFRPRQGDHSYFIYWTEAGKKSVVKTKTSHGNSTRDLGDDLLGKMAKQCALTKKLFLDLIDCPLSRAEYEAMLKEDGKA